MIFIAATDDRGWLEEAFVVKTKDFLADNIYFSHDLFNSVGVKNPGAGEDLALLSLCNHFIISVSRCSKDSKNPVKFSSICQASTFGQWGALLAGGQVLKHVWQFLFWISNF